MKRTHEQEESTRHVSNDTLLPLTIKEKLIPFFLYLFLLDDYDARTLGKRIQKTLEDIKAIGWKTEDGADDLVRLRMQLDRLLELLPHVLRKGIPEVFDYMEMMSRTVRVMKKQGQDEVFPPQELHGLNMLVRAVLDDLARIRYPDLLAKISTADELRQDIRELYKEIDQENSREERNDDVMGSKLNALLKLALQLKTRGEPMGLDKKQWNKLPIIAARISAHAFDATLMGILWDLYEYDLKNGVRLK